jgi:hypothetical protein
MHNKDNMTIFLADYSPVVEACKCLEGMREMVQLRTKHLIAFHAIWWQFPIQNEEYCDCAESSDEDEEAECGRTSKQHHRLGY